MIVDYTYYTTEYLGEEMDSTEFDKLNLRAEDDIILISNKDLSLIEDWEESFLKKAICSQVEWYYVNGDTYNSSGASSEKIGAYSRNGGNNQSGGGSKESLCTRAKQYLSYTNLLYRGQC